MAATVLLLAEPCLYLLTGTIAAPETLRIVQCLLIAALISIVANGTAKRLLVVSDQHRLVMKLSIAEAVMNLVVSLLLLWYWQHPLAAAVGTLVAHVVVPPFMTVPLACRHCGLSLAEAGLVGVVVFSRYVPIWSCS